MFTYLLCSVCSPCLISLQYFPIDEMSMNLITISAMRSCLSLKWKIMAAQHWLQEDNVPNLDFVFGIHSVCNTASSYKMKKILNLRWQFANPKIMTVVLAIFCGESLSLNYKRFTKLNLTTYNITLL